jgi:hypothetical protein
MAVFGQSGNHPKIARLDMLAGLLGLHHHHLHVSAQQIRDALPATRKRNEYPFCAGGPFDDEPHQIVSTGNRTAGLSQLSGTLLGGFNKIFHALKRRIRFDRDHGRLQDQADDGSQVLDRNRRFLGRQGFVTQTPVKKPIT